MGYEKVEQDSRVTVKDGIVMLRRINGEDITIQGTVEVHKGDEIYWTADCTYTQRHS
jgi:hypothetical protein